MYKSIHTVKKFNFEDHEHYFRKAFRKAFVLEFIINKLLINFIFYK